MYVAMYVLIVYMNGGISRIPLRSGNTVTDIRYVGLYKIQI